MKLQNAQDVVNIIRDNLFVTKGGESRRVEYPSIFEAHDTLAEVANIVECVCMERSALAKSLLELVHLAEHGDADLDEVNWHPALERARTVLAGVMTSSPPFEINLREKAIILAALRLYQRSFIMPTDIQDIASDGGALISLTDEEIDKLCERIN